MKDTHKIALALIATAGVYVAYYLYKKNYGGRAVWQGPLPKSGGFRFAPSVMGNPNVPWGQQGMQQAGNFLSNRMGNFSRNAAPHPFSPGETPFMP
jgi:hypothetical protein